MRPLTLHASALSDSEYELYTASLDDLAADVAPTSSGTAPVRDDAEYERTSVGAREARAWLRGRYPDLLASDIDAILKLFCPNMLPSDTLTGGQFFAVLRLVVHAKSGKGVDRTLAFVQASPPSAKASDLPRPRTPPKRPVQAPPSHPDRQRAPPPPPSSPDTNPFARRSTEHAAASVPPPDPEPAPPFAPQQRFAKLSHNPFLARDKHDAGADKTAPLPVLNAPNHGKLPPLPPRQPSLLAVPPRRPSEAVPTPITSTAHLTPPCPPLIPAKPTHVMSPLMRQSLEASKHAQSMKRAEEQLDRERVLQVLKTSSSNSSIGTTTPSVRTRSRSPSKPYPRPRNGHGAAAGPDSGSGGSDDATYVPPLPRRRTPSQPSSTTSSVLSLEQVASATLGPPVGPPPLLKPPLPSRVDVHGPPGPIPPPMHPDRRPGVWTEPTVNDGRASPPGSSPRVARSKSVTSSSSSSGLPPLPRRRRPESVQLTSSSMTTTTDVDDLPALASVYAYAHAQQHGRTTSFQGLSRHPSLTRDSDRGQTDAASASPIAHIQRRFSHLQLKAQPRLDAARYKAEAGISRRGYVHPAHLGGTRWRDEGAQGLMEDARWTAANVDRGVDSGPTTDDEPSSGEDRGPRRATESDNLKLPMGEGWNRL